MYDRSGSGRHLRGVIIVVWNPPDGSVILEGCQGTLIFDNTLLEPLTCRYTFEGEEFDFEIDEIPFDFLISNVSFLAYLAYETELVSELTAGETLSLVVKLENAAALAENGYYLPSGNLVAAFVYEAVSHVKGDYEPDWLP